jgi:hypothetical protein
MEKNSKNTKETRRDLNQNEGEGSTTAGRQYDEAATDFAKHGEVEKAAHEAKEAYGGEEGEELRRAEREGKSHAAEEEEDARHAAPPQSRPHKTQADDKDRRE